MTAKWFHPLKPFIFLNMRFYFSGVEFEPIGENRPTIS